MTPRDQALTRIPEAQRWVGTAAIALNRIIGFNGTRSDVAKLPEFRAINTHFHVTIGSDPGLLAHLIQILPFMDDFGDPTLASLKQIRLTYWNIQNALSSAKYLDAPAEGEGKDATAFVPRERDGTVRITPLYLDVGPLSQVLVLVHEAVHFLGDRYQEWAYRDRTNEENPRGYIDLPIQYALFNPDSYAYYAVQMAKGIDRILKQSE